ncbi:rhodanese-like domain-containing protein [Streptomyces odontomachi]|uniref:rhodanese-like domain-containing protein n=1 Tax=Streptomyces odontomachi TaxID=2944940 RepID=UPI0021092C09|nr:rhodanese-like domain-containing protein [Streptomyces sp. ODS25]
MLFSRLALLAQRLFSRRIPSRVTPAQAHRMTQEGTAVLLDVRETHEYAAGHVPGALHLPLSLLTAGAADVPGCRDGRSPVLICRSGNRSQRAARLLAGRGVQAVDVTGGMTAWARQGLPVRDGNGAAGTVI